MYKFLLPAAALMMLSACDDIFDRQGVGFTGLNGEPRTFTEQKWSADFVTRRISVPAELAAQPVIRLQVESASMAELAGVAIENGGQTPDTAVEVGGDGKTLLMSQVDVNGVLFAVFRTPAGRDKKMTAGQGAQFAASVPRLTGCLVAGTPFQEGTSERRTKGYAVPLNCS